MLQVGENWNNGTGFAVSQPCSGFQRVPFVKKAPSEMEHFTQSPSVKRQSSIKSNTYQVFHVPHQQATQRTSCVGEQF